MNLPSFGLGFDYTYYDTERPMNTTLLEQDMFYNYMYIF
jgi:hypothetical protein